MSRPQSDTQQTAYVRKDIYQQVTDSIIAQLEIGTVPWQQPWTGDERAALTLPQNFNTGKKYRGVNIVLLWSAAIAKNHTSAEWGSYLQWKAKGEAIRKDEKGTMIVYYDTLLKEKDDEVKRLPFLKHSVVFNRCQLASFTPGEQPPEEARPSLVQRVEKMEAFIANTKAIIEYGAGSASYNPLIDRINMPEPASFVDTNQSTATENYYATLSHEVIHWSGSVKRLNRKYGKRFGDPQYATEELIAELGGAFLCAGFDITSPERAGHASYIAHWLKVLKEDKRCIFTAASEASKAVDYLEGLQPG